MSEKKAKKVRASKKQIIAELWKRGELTYKLNPAQLKMREAFKNDERKIIPILASRRTGKTFMLTVDSIEICIKKAFAVVKFLCPTQKQVKTNVKAIMREILKDCPEALKPEWKENDKLYRFPNGSEIQLAGSDGKQYENLRGGCFTSETKIMTPNGPVAIINLSVGDKIYGYNKDGSVSTTTVKNKFYNGIQKVTEFKKGPNVLGACTDKHTWLTQTTSSYYRQDGAIKERNFREINDRMYIRRNLPNIPCGNVNEPDAYLIGAFIGDGCCTCKGNVLQFSTKDKEIADHIGKHLNVEYKDEIDRYCRVFFTTNIKLNQPSLQLSFNYYNEWLKNKKFHEKNFNYHIVDQWNRNSCLKLLAGLLDSDGNVYFNSSGIELTFNHSNLPLIKNIQKLLFKLFQVRAKIKHDKRIQYTIPHYKLIVRSGFMVKRILLEMEPFIILSRKRWKKEYEQLRLDEKPEIMKITKGLSWYDHTYDLEVDNETHLYLTADGLITHNSADRCIVDEAGTCNDLYDAVFSVLQPTTATTEGQIFLASTPSKLSTHDFIQTFVLPAKAEDKLLIFTIDDNTMISDKEKARILSVYPGGEKNPEYRREYRCEIVDDLHSTVVPEFNSDTEKDLIREIELPRFFDAYVSCDVGFKDLTVVLFGYYDFMGAKLVIIDELVLNGPEMTTKRLAKDVREKEEELFKDEIDGKPMDVYMRIIDNNNLILVNDLSVLHNLSFLATAKDNKEAQINHVRMMVNNEQIIIHPKCKHLIYHLKSATWDKNRKDFNHLPDLPQINVSGGHADALDALIYMVRNLVKSHNPYPENWGTGVGTDTFYRKGKQKNPPLFDKVKQMLNIK